MTKRNKRRKTWRAPTCRHCGDENIKRGRSTWGGWRFWCGTCLETHLSAAAYARRKANA